MLTQLVLGGRIGRKVMTMRLRSKLSCFIVPVLLTVLSLAARASPRVVHVFVALADNQHQGIVPVPARLGDGDAPAGNLYWGAAFGVKSFFRSSKDWELISASPGPSLAILERCVFKHRSEDVYVVADAYRGSHMHEAVTDFLYAASGLNSQSLVVKSKQGSVAIMTSGGA